MHTITFILSYNSRFGENIFICGNIPELGLTEENAVPMEYTDEGWNVTIRTSDHRFQYSYLVREEGETTRKETPLSHPFRLPEGNYETIRIYDHFSTGTPIPAPMLSSVFSKSIMAHIQKKEEKEKPGKKRTSVIFNTQHHQISRNHLLAISGNDSFFGKWIEDDMQKMDGGEFPTFHLVCDAKRLLFPLEYKYAILDAKDNSLICWEKGENRRLNPIAVSAADLIIVNDSTPDFNLPVFKGAGVTAPVFALRTKKSFGTGEFYDLKLLIDWVAKTGQKMIQTLPVNDTTTFHQWQDSYPYNSTSVFALHPMYLNLEKMGEIANVQQYEALRKELNSHKFVDYEAVNRYKWEFINELYPKERNKTFKSKEYRLFFETNKEWLQPYAVYCFLRDKYQTTDFSQWKQDAVFQAENIERYCNSANKHYHLVAIHFFVQFHLHKQLSEVAAYAHEKGVALKGDIPIGVNRHSVEVWTHPDLFDCTGQTGAPPDDFSMKGQNWGFPTYQWNNMAKNNYAWWAGRLQKMSQYFDAYRIDHILGFFRIFRIPQNQVWGLLGQFSPALPLSVDEIEDFGLKFDKKAYCQPTIHEDYLEELFGNQVETVKKKYLKPIKNKRYQLKNEVDDQQKIEQLLGHPVCEEEQIIKEGLMALACEVLFIPDVKEAKKYHPRIAIRKSLAFRALDSGTQEAFNKLYVHFYYQRHNEFWEKEALKKLPPIIRSTNMLVCGEDLGMIPLCVPKVMAQLEILSLEIQRMPKEQDVEFEVLEKIPYFSVCTPSTHDMNNLRTWWQEDPQRTQHYFNNVMHEYGDTPLRCEPWICQQIVEKHLFSPAMWVIFSLQDWMAIDGNLRSEETFDERINDPANPNNQWKYRMYLSLEELLEKEEFNQMVASMIRHVGR